MGEKEKGRFVVSSGRLVAASDLRREYLDDFCAAARRLLEEPGPELVLDLSRVRFIFSTFVGVVSNLAQDCHNLGKRLIVRVPERLAWVFRIDRTLTLFMRLETVTEEGES